MTRISPVMSWRRPWKRRVQKALRMLPSHRSRLLAGALDSTGNIALFNYLRSSGKHFPTLISGDVLPSTSGSESWFEQYAAGFAVDLPAAETGMRLDAGITLPGLFLQKVDVATMAFSLAIQDTRRTNQVSSEEGAVQTSSPGTGISAQDGVWSTDCPLAAGATPTGMGAVSGP